MAKKQFKSPLDVWLDKKCSPECEYYDKLDGGRCRWGTERNCILADIALKLEKLRGVER